MLLSDKLRSSNQHMTREDENTLNKGSVSKCQDDFTHIKTFESAIFD